MSDVRLSADSLAVLCRVALARSDDPARYQLCGVYVGAGVKAGLAEVCATNGKILAVAQLECEGKGLEKGVILGAAALAAVRKCFAVRKGELRPKGLVRGEVSADRFTLWMDGTKSEFPHLEAVFPDYSCVYPTNLQPQKGAWYDPQYLKVATEITGADTWAPVSSGGKDDAPGWVAGVKVAVAVMPLISSGSRKDHQAQTIKGVEAILRPEVVPGVKVA